MEHQKGVKAAIGEENVKIFLKEIENGLMKKVDLKKIALKMHGRVHGTFVKYTENCKENDLADVARSMLDSWFKEELYKAGNHVQNFKRILRDEGFDYLCIRMEDNIVQQTAPNQVEPKNLTTFLKQDSIEMFKVQLSDEEKRHIVVGVVISSVLDPSLKDYVDRKLFCWHKTLVVKHNIGSRQIGNEMAEKLLGTKVKEKYISIKNYIELANLFLENERIKDINSEKSNISVILQIMSMAKCFSNEERKLAKQVRIM